MESRLVRIYVILGLTILAIVGLYLFFSTTQTVLQTPQETSPTSQSLPQNWIGGTPISVNSETAPIHSPEFNVRVKDAHTIVLEWLYLPVGIQEIDAFRTKKGSASYQFWKTITIANWQSEGFFEIALGANENANAYSFYFQLFSDKGVLSQITQEAPATTTTILIPPSPPASTSTSASVPPTSTVVAPPPEPIHTPPTATSAPASTVIPSISPLNGIPIYTPSGKMIGTNLLPTENFWALYVNNKLQFNWQLLPANTDTIIIDRSTSSAVTGAQLLAQQNPIPYRGTMELVDASFDAPHYYTLRALHTSEEVAHYGPILVPPLAH